MKKQPLKIGFDLDGVILYNPIRVVRPFIAFFKKQLLRKQKLKFYYPNSRIEKFIWSLFHKTSIFTADGLNEVKNLAQNDHIEPYIITARYNFLKKDFQKWLKKIDADKYFKGYFYNKDDEQPHLFKEKIIRKLDLDIFVEDNWDIVNYLNPKLKSKIFWIYNIFDRYIKHDYKFSSMQNVVSEIKKHLQVEKG